MRIVLTGGGTDGHIVPLSALLRELRSQQSSWREKIPVTREPSKLEFVFVGAATEQTRELFARWDIPVIHIAAGKLRRYASSQNIVDLLFRLPFSIVRALFVLWRVMPDVVISKGGFGSIPTSIAAWWYRIPIVVHESDAVPGIANSFVARFAKVVALGFTEAKPYFTKYRAALVVTGTPSRFTGSAVPEKVAAKQSFGFAPEDTVLLVMGGSQGAQQINELLLKVLPALITEVGVIHVTGPDNFTAVSTVAKELLASSAYAKRYHVFGYLEDNYATALAAADIVVSRSGATTLVELAALQKPALLIPLDSAASDHQRKNAQVLEQAGAAVVLDPANLGPHLFEQMLHRLMESTDIRTQLSDAIGAFAHPNAAKQLAEISFNLASGRQAIRDA